MRERARQRETRERESETFRGHRGRSDASRKCWLVGFREGTQESLRKRELICDHNIDRPKTSVTCIWRQFWFRYFDVSYMQEVRIHEATCQPFATRTQLSHPTSLR